MFEANKNILHQRDKNRYKNVKTSVFQMGNMDIIIYKVYLLIKMMKRNMIEKQKTKCEK